VKQDIIHVPDGKKRAFLDKSLEDEVFNHIIIFTRSRRNVEVLSESLSRKYRINGLFKEMGEDLVKNIFRDFLFKICPILVTNDDVKLTCICIEMNADAIPFIDI
jgi:superfamily II DNA/RNA helicase